MNKYLEAYKETSKLTPKDFLLVKIRKADKLVTKACKKAEKYDELKTPKKLIQKIDKDGRCILCCPSCNNILVKFWSEVETITPQNYCDECGQRLEY